MSGDSIKAWKLGDVAATPFSPTSPPKFSISEVAKRRIRLPGGKVVTVGEATTEEFQAYIKHIHRQFERIAKPFLKAAGKDKNKQKQVTEILSPVRNACKEPVSALDERWYVLLELRTAIGGPSSRYGSIKLFVEEKRGAA